jgi:hypothetical protein
MPEVRTETALASAGEPKGIFAVLGDIGGLKGGFAEPGPGDTLNVLLPPETAAPAGLEEEMVLSLTAGWPGARYAGYGSDTLEAFARLLSEEGGLAEFALCAPHHLKSSGFEKLLQEALTPINGLLRLRDTEPA